MAFGKNTKKQSKYRAEEGKAQQRATTSRNRVSKHNKIFQNSKRF
jgi:hypothetical protein